VQVPTVIELEDDSQEYNKFLGLYFFTVFLSFLFLMREFLEVVADGLRKYFSSGRFPYSPYSS
jgi:hypothetical protein